MGAVGSLLKTAAFGIVGGALLNRKPKAAVQPVALPQATPRTNSVLADALANRRGAATNQRTGASGVESSTTSKKQLLGQ